MYIKEDNIPETAKKSNKVMYLCKYAAPYSPCPECHNAPCVYPRCKHTFNRDNARDGVHYFTKSGDWYKEIEKVK